MKRIFVIFLLLTIVVSCSSKNDGDKYIIHPSGENHLENEEISFEINNEENSSMNKKKESILQKIQGRIKTAEIGTLDKSTKEIFSSIDQVIVNDKDVLLLDGHSMKLSHFNIRGDFIKSLQLKGNGPGEFTQPNSIDVFQDSIYITDRYFSVKKGSIEDLVLKDLRYEFKTPLEQICISDSAIVIKSTTINEKEPKLYQLYSIGQREKRLTFGDTYKTSDIIAKEILSEGLISCQKEQKNLFGVLYSLPYIYSYKLNGEIRWVSEIEEYIPLKFREEKGRGMSTRWNNDTYIYDEYISMFNFQNNIVLQTERFESSIHSGEVKIESKEIYTYLINSADGEGVFLTKTLPKIAYLNDEYLVLKGEENYPTIEIFSL
ncbi:MAG: 6-bladed beta-propeller [Gracilimonas sp.]